MRSPKKGRQPRLTLADLAPKQITCFWCLKPKPAEGARPFRSHHVCADCVPLVGAGTMSSKAHTEAHKNQSGIK